MFYQPANCASTLAPPSSSPPFPRTAPNNTNNPFRLWISPRGLDTYRNPGKGLFACLLQKPPENLQITPRLHHPVLIQLPPNTHARLAPIFLPGVSGSLSQIPRQANTLHLLRKPNHWIYSLLASYNGQGNDTAVNLERLDLKKDLYLLTGATGLLGGNIVRELVDRGHSVRALGET